MAGVAVEEDIRARLRYEEVDDLSDDAEDERDPEDPAPGEVGFDEATCDRCDDATCDGGEDDKGDGTMIKRLADISKL